jgi:hypothetical protein
VTMMPPLLFDDGCLEESSGRVGPFYYVPVGRPRSRHPVLYVATVDGIVGLRYRGPCTLG